jgi:hypothetical protein
MESETWKKLIHGDDVISLGFRYKYRYCDFRTHNIRPRRVVPSLTCFRSYCLFFATMSGGTYSVLHRSLCRSFGSLCCLPDFGIPNLFDVKGKIGACIYPSRGYHHVTNTTGSCGHRWWLWGWYDDRHCLRAERRQGLHRISQGGATQGGACHVFVLMQDPTSDLL